MTSAQLSKLIIPKPFASDGSVTPIVATSEDMPNFSTGFPENFSAPHSGDGRYVARSMMNAVGNMATVNEHFRQGGGIYQFDADWAVANGGYAKGAILDFLNGTQLYKVMSLIDNNLVDYTGKQPSQAQADAGVTVGGVDGVHWIYCNVDQKVLYNEICDVPNFSWPGQKQDMQDVKFFSETFPIGYAKFARSGIIGFTGAINFTAYPIKLVIEESTTPSTTTVTEITTGGIGIVACKKLSDGTLPNPWTPDTPVGDLIYQRGCLATFSLNYTSGSPSKAYSFPQLKMLSVSAGDEYAFYIINFGGSVENSSMKIVLI